MLKLKVLFNTILDIVSKKLKIIKGFLKKNFEFFLK